MLKRLPITFWATVFVTVVCVALVSLDFWRSWNARGVLLEETERSSTNLARAMSQHADDTIKAADTSLADLEERIEMDGLHEGHLARLHQVMLGQVRALPQLDGLYAYDEGGRWMVNSQAKLDRKANNADREYFRYHRENRDKGPHIGLPVISRSSGKWIIPVSRRIDKPDGSFGGVVLATIDIDYFRRFYASLDIGDNGAVALLSNRGVMLVRQPFRSEGIGASIADTPLYQAYSRSGTTGTGMFRSTQDGQVRLNSYRPLQNYPLFVTAALSKEEALAHWRRDTWLHSLGVVALAALLALFGQRLIGQMRRRLEAERELRQARDALASLNATLEKMALQDGLTGLANRRQLDVSLGNEFSRATRQGTSLALALIDVDHFKLFNDRYGHSAGDDCLRAISRAIRQQTPKRAGDLAARYGGEELAVLLPNTDIAGAWAVAERMRQAVEALQLPHADSAQGIVTISAGVAALVPRRGVDAATTLIEAADKALYAAKSAGRNQVAPDLGPAPVLTP